MSKNSRSVKQRKSLKHKDHHFTDDFKHQIETMLKIKGKDMPSVEEEFGSKFQELKPCVLIRFKDQTGGKIPRRCMPT